MRNRLFERANPIGELSKWNMYFAARDVAYELVVPFINQIVGHCNNQIWTGRIINWFVSPARPIVSELYRFHACILTQKGTSLC